MVALVTLCFGVLVLAVLCVMSRLRRRDTGSYVLDEQSRKLPLLQASLHATSTHQLQANNAFTRGNTFPLAQGPLAPTAREFYAWRAWNAHEMHFNGHRFATNFSLPPNTSRPFVDARSVTRGGWCWKGVAVFGMESKNRQRSELGITSLFLLIFLCKSHFSFLMAFAHFLCPLLVFFAFLVQFSIASYLPRTIFSTTFSIRFSFAQISLVHSLIIYYWKREKSIPFWGEIRNYLLHHSTLEIDYLLDRISSQYLVFYVLDSKTSAFNYVKIEDVRLAYNFHLPNI